MKILSIAFLMGICFVARTQSLQLHFDPRHTLNRRQEPKNYATLYFEYYKSQDSGTRFFKPGSFLLKMQADFLGEKNNIGKFYMQVSQSFRCWKPKIFVNLQYSGGLGITEPREYSYYIVNNFSVGLAYPFQWSGAYLSVVLNYKYIPYKRPSHDPIFTLYWWKGFWNYRLEFSGDFSLWTQNRNLGDDLTKDLSGKQLSFFAEPQCWYNINKVLAAGTRAILNYHISTPENVLKIYPTLALRCKL